MSTTERLVALNTVPGLVKQAILEAEGGELIDVLGTANSIQSQIGAIKRTAAAEVTDGEHGDRWRFEQGRKANRTYNTNGLLATLRDELEFEELQQVLIFLLNRDVIRLNWQWSKLTKLVKEHNLDLKVARHEITDGDPEYDMGEWWTAASPSYEVVDAE